jgi:hypothetical protein
MNQSRFSTVAKFAFPVLAAGAGVLRSGPLSIGSSRR